MEDHQIHMIQKKQDVMKAEVDSVVTIVKEVGGHHEDMKEGDRTPALAHDQEAAIGLIVEEADHDLGHPDIVADQFLGRLEDQEHQGDRLHPEEADLDHVVEVDRDQEHDICESD